MARIFIIWSSTEGQTRRIVQVMEKDIRDAGHKLETLNADDPPRGWIFSKADAVLVAASVHAGKHSDGLVRLLKQHHARLTAVPSALLSVSLSAADPTKQEEADRYVAELLAAVDWKPSVTATVGGALRYPEYPFFKRFMLKRIAQKAGMPTDTSRVHEFTDWERVHTFTARLLELTAAAELQPA